MFLLHKARFSWVSQSLKARKIHKSPALKLFSTEDPVEQPCLFLNSENVPSHTYLTLSLRNEKTKENPAHLS